MKKKKITLLMFSVFAISFININLNADKDILSNLTLSNIEALAQNEQTVRDCPGGSCTHTNSFGEKCTACCNKDDRPKCGTFGCECTWR